MLRKFNTFLDYIYVAGYSYLETQNVVKKIWLTKYKTSLIFLATAAFTGTEYHSTIVPLANFRPLIILFSKMFEIF